MALLPIQNDDLPALYESIIQFSDDAIIAKTLEGIVTSWNPAAEALFGYGPDEIIGQHISLIIPEDRASEEMDIIAKIRAGEHVRHYETHRRRKDGSIVFISLTVSPLKDKNGVITGASKIARDITKQKLEERRLKLLESVITNTTDAVLVTEAAPLYGQGPAILYVNDAFTQMTGYTAEEIMGKTPRILQGPKSDVEELKRLSACLKKFEPCEVTVINYKKTGEAFWINFTVNPVFDEKGQATHFIAIERDITRQKNEEHRQRLLASISAFFIKEAPLNETMDEVLAMLVEFGGFCLAEAWLIETEKDKLILSAKIYQTPAIAHFFEEDARVKSLVRGGGLTGTAWATGVIQRWTETDNRVDFRRHSAAKKAGIKSAYGLPLLYNTEVIGVLVLGLALNREDTALTGLLESISTFLGAEIRRKQLEQELNQVFHFAPDILCIANTDGYFKKVNPAMSSLLEYSEAELLSKPYMSMVHPADKNKTAAELQNIINGRPTYYIENRYITKSGKIKWLAWTTTAASAHGVLYCSAKDITDKKELEELLRKATSLARIGGWEVDVVNGTVYWSDITKEIHEVPPDFQPDLSKGINFYKEGASRDLINTAVQEAISKGTPWDMEAQIVTAKDFVKWVRVIGETEFANGKCTRIIGSFQDIDARKKAEAAVKAVLEERNAILESIGDAFFAVDKNWVVTYWNNMAEKVLATPRDTILNRALWEVFAGSVSSLSYRQYHAAIQTGRPVHFEDYFSPLDKWYEISAYPAGDGLSVFFKDVTERKKAMAALEESEQKYHQLFHLSPLPMWVVNLDTLEFLDVNRATVNHYGYSREEFLTMGLADIRPPEEMARLQLGITESRATGKLTDNIMTHRKKSGEIIKVAIEVAPFQFRGANVNIVIASDITARLQAVQAIEEQNEKLKEIAWLQSHVIRAPLARMMGLINLIKDRDCTAPEREQYIEYVLSSAYELDGIIRNITDKTSKANEIK